MPDSPTVNPVLPVDPISGALDETALIGFDLGTVPLDAQIFPYDDFKAAGRQGRPSLFPDDVYSIYAINGGQKHSDPQQQTTATITDDHRLRVETQSTGGGGGELVATKVVTGRDGLIAIPDTVMTLPGPVSTILSSQITVQINNGGAESHCVIRMVGATTGNVKVLTAISCPLFSAAAGRVEPVLILVIDRPLDVTDVFGSGEDVHIQTYDISNLFGNIDITMYYS